MDRFARGILFLLPIFLVLTAGSWGWAAIDYKQAISKKKHNYIEQGVVTGGEAGTGFSLLNVRKRFAKKAKVERIFLDLGDIDGRPLTNYVSYFQVSIDPEASEVRIDLPQVMRAGVSDEGLLKTFRKSRFVKSAEIIFDPEDLTTSLIFRLKKDAQMEVFEMPSKKKASRIVIDLKAL